MMSPTNHRAVWLFAAVAAYVLTGCTSAALTGKPGIDALGGYLLREKGPETTTLLGYRFAARSFGEPWLILELAISSPKGAAANIERDKIFVLTPGGRRVPLATYKEFADSWRELQGKTAQAAVARDPMDYFPPTRRPCALPFFPKPGTTVPRSEVEVNDIRVCTGRLFFKIQGGIQPGRYVFGIDLEESDIRIPFTLEVG